jgi:hypothetical protein
MLPEDFFDTDASPPIIVRLSCNGCKNTFSRKFAWAMVSPDHAVRSADWDGILLSDVVTCPECGAVDAYAIAPESVFGLTARILGPPTDSGKPDRVALGASRLWDGTIVHRPTHALAHVRWLTETHPRSAQAFRCLGNACSRWRRMEEAVAAWRRSCELDTNEIDAAFQLANHLLVPVETHAEGFFYLRRAIAAIPSAAKAATVPADIIRGVFRLLSFVAQHSEDDIALMAAWPSGEYRNEPAITMSAVDLRKVHDFERLADLAAAGHFITLGLAPDLPDEDETTHLERLVANSPPHEPVPQRLEDVFRHTARHLRSSSTAPDRRTGRNAPCPCGSGRKYKRCCGRI